MLKKQEILNGNWRNLIILDACRYDSFEKIYDQYLDGKLEKRKSRGTNTPEWLHKSFTKKLKKVTYLSANPFINSQGIDLQKTTGGYYKYKWKPTDYFKKIVDVWNTHWNEELGTVHPRGMNNAIRKYLQKKERNIIHYMQPHGPFINYKIGYGDCKNIRRVNREKEGIAEKVKRKIHDRSLPLVFLFFKKIPLKQKLKIKKLSGVELTPFQKFYAEGRITELKGYYKNNLKTVLEYLSKILDNLNGKTVITSDHGEAFGENGLLEHPYHVPHTPTLSEVPWFLVK